jgi:hypothetical protein
VASRWLFRYLGKAQSINQSKAGCSDILVKHNQSIKSWLFRYLCKAQSINQSKAGCSDILEKHNKSINQKLAVQISW